MSDVPDTIRDHCDYKSLSMHTPNWSWNSHFSKEPEMDAFQSCEIKSAYFIHTHVGPTNVTNKISETFQPRVPTWERPAYRPPLENVEACTISRTVPIATPLSCVLYVRNRSNHSRSCLIQSLLCIVKEYPRWREEELRACCCQEIDWKEQQQEKRSKKTLADNSYGETYWYYCNKIVAERHTTTHSNLRE